MAHSKGAPVIPMVSVDMYHLYMREDFWGYAGGARVNRLDGGDCENFLVFTQLLVYGKMHYLENSSSPRIVLAGERQFDIRQIRFAFQLEHHTAQRLTFDWKKARKGRYTQGRSCLMKIFDVALWFDRLLGSSAARFHFFGPCLGSHSPIRTSIEPTPAIYPAIWAPWCRMIGAHYEHGLAGGWGVQ